MATLAIPLFPRNFLLFFFIITSPNFVKSQALINSCPIPAELSTKLHVDPAAQDSVSTDYGNIVHNKPKAVLYPTSVQDIASLVKASFTCSVPFGISVRGNGHSTHGQDQANNGVVVDMKSLRELRKRGSGIVISKDNSYADVGGEQLWIDVLTATSLEGVSPVSWTDYLYITVGGTLSNAGISGQAFRFGPQIDNVLELDVITGKGELLTVSPNQNPELFYAVLGGLGQFGIITRARIPLAPALKRVRWTQLLYSNFNDFITAQEYYIGQGSSEIKYLEGAVLFDNGTPNIWRTFFFPPADLPKINSLIKQYGIIYSIELTSTSALITTDKEPELFNEKQAALPVYSFGKDVAYTEFLTRVQISVLNNESHPWFNLFIPKSGVSNFNIGVFKDIVLKRNITTGPVLFYPMFRNKWNDRTSAVIPDEDIFYTTGLLYTSGVNGWQTYEDQNKAILDFCARTGINIKQYLPNYTTQEDWIKQFGSKWATIKQRKTLFDPKLILSPGQKVFN